MSKLSRLLLFTLAFLLIWSFISPKEKVENFDDIVLKTDSKIAIGKEVILEVQNHGAETITIPSSCPRNPLRVERYTNGEWIEETAETDSRFCDNKEVILEPGKTLSINYAPWNQSLFDEKGRYRITLATQVEEKERIYSKEITVGSSGIFRTFWLEVFYKPILNTLIFFISTLSGNSLGWGIILLTILIKLILLVPNHKALRAQKQMQRVQPQLDALKKKHKDNPKRLANETMKIWQKHKVNPMSSCLPILIQFPVLIALFYVVKDGLDFINPHLLYASLKSFDASLIEPVFLGLIDLTKINIFVLPIIIGLLQFGQMKLTLGKTLKNQPAAAGSLMPMMNKTMIYFMPVLIAVFTASLPAAVGFYWGTSTIFGIGQQIVVNKSKD